MLESLHYYSMWNEILLSWHSARDVLLIYSIYVSVIVIAVTHLPYVHFCNGIDGSLYLTSIVHTFSSYKINLNLKMVYIFIDSEGFGPFPPHKKVYFTECALYKTIHQTGNKENTRVLESYIL